ncbi:hypothetical protein CPC08DRAFT_249354 [Agrocybe pediades]|nr:hypothetical protein CPC08DRAFT_249354 [Agrocybe pediades]
MMDQDSSSHVQLPPEILSQIFSLAIPKQHPFQKNSPEVTLSHVSSYWRAAALTTSSLWTKIVVFSRRSRPRLKAYLQRSGTRNVDITIDVYRYERRLHVNNKPWGDKQGAFTAAILEMILMNMDRIRSLSFLYFSKTNLLRMVVSLYQTRALNLQRLEFKYDAEEAFLIPEETDVPGKIWIFEGGGPNLRYLSSDMPTLRPSVFRNIISLDLNCPSLVGVRLESLIEMIAVPAKLRYLTLRGYVDINPRTFIQHPIQLELPHLQGLRLDSGLMAAKFLLSISAPIVESLWLNCSVHEWDGFSRFISASPALPGFSTLKYLTMPNHDLTSIDGIARMFPSITHLHLPHVLNTIQSARLLNALTFSWAFVDTIILSMLEDQQNEHLVTNLKAYVLIRHDHQRPTSRILVNEDQFDKLRRAFEGFPPRAVEVLLLNSTTYTEMWWTKQDQLALS